MSGCQVMPSTYKDTQFGKSLEEFRNIFPDPREIRLEVPVQPPQRSKSAVFRPPRNFLDLRRPILHTPPRTTKCIPGGVVEWSIAPVLKTGEPKGSVGSNPTPSATFCPILPVPCQMMSATLSASVRGRSSTISLRDWSRMRKTKETQSLC